MLNLVINIVVGDSHLNNVEIVKMDDEYVIVEVKIRKRCMYPPVK